MIELFALLLTPPPIQDTPPSSDWNCDDPQYQQEMNWCAGQDYARADAELNAQWKLTAAHMKQYDADGIDDPRDGRPGYFDTLLEAQRAWIKYRDAHCRSDGYQFRGGTMEPLINASCKAALTRERTEQLKALMPEQY